MASPESLARDLALARAAANRDPHALERFAERMACVPRFVRALCNRDRAPLTQEDQEDIAQEAIASLWRRLSDYRGDASLETWAYRFTDLTYRNARRRRFRRDRHGMHALSEAAAADAATQADASTASDLEERDSVLALVDRLGDLDSRLLTARFLDDLTIQEIAAHFAMPENTVKSRLRRALAKLRGALPGGGAP